MSAKKDPPASLQYTKMLFLVSHGLQTPLSAIRWGCGRMKRTSKNLTKEQGDILENVLSETRVLSKMIDWLLLLAKVEEGVHTPNVQDVFLNDMLTSPATLETVPRRAKVAVTGPKDASIRVDRTLLESIIGALLLTASMGSKAKTIKLSFDFHKKPDRCVVTVHAPLMLSLLEEGEKHSKRKVVGGVPGFLLSVASSLAKAVGGKLDSVQKRGTVESLVLTLPPHPSITPIV